MIQVHSYLSPHKWNQDSNSSHLKVLKKLCQFLKMPFLSLLSLETISNHLVRGKKTLVSWTIGTKINKIKASTQVALLSAQILLGARSP